jgi:phage-related protein
MPEIRVVFYREADGSVPMLDWFNRLDRKARAKCRWLIEQLQERGHELSDYLRDEVYELRTRQGNVRYRMLYFFHGTAQAVISHGITKKTAEVPPNRSRQGN